MTFLVSMRRISLFIIALTVLWSCKKTKMEGELSVLVGTWEWRYTIKTDDFCGGFSGDSLVTNSPAIDGLTYSLTFEKKGKLIIRQNGKKEKSYRITHQPPYKDNQFTFYLNNKKKKGISVAYGIKNGNERIETNYFPMSILSGFNGCEVKYSVFEKIE